MRTVAYDLDGTLFSIKQCIELFNQRTNKKYSLKDIEQYSFGYLYGLSPEEYLETWLSISEEVIVKSEVNEKMLQNLRLEKEQGSRILIVTARDKKLERLSEESLIKHNIHYDGIYSGSEDKYATLKKENVSRFFDDRGELIHRLMQTDLEKSCELTIVDAPYNKNFQSHSRFIL